MKSQTSSVMISAESVSIPRNARKRRTSGQNSGSDTTDESRSSSASLRAVSPSHAARLSMNASSVPACSKVCAESHSRCTFVHALRSLDTRPWRNSSFESRCRQRIRSTLTCSRARARSRAASHVADGTTTAVNPPAIS